MGRTKQKTNLKRGALRFSGISASPGRHSHLENRSSTPLIFDGESDIAPYFVVETEWRVYESAHI